MKKGFGGRLEQEQERIRISAFVIAVVICVLLSFFYLVLDITESGQSWTSQLEERINPNDASSGSLARLPGVGVVKAIAIITYRDSFNENHDDKVAFGDCGDLQKVKGIGPKTARNISRWLKFE